MYPNNWIAKYVTLQFLWLNIGQIRQFWSILPLAFFLPSKGFQADIFMLSTFPVGQNEKTVRQQIQ